MLPSWNNYLKSRQATINVSSIDNTIKPKPANVRTLIDSQQVAALAVMSQDNVLTAIYHPRHLPDPAGGIPTKIFGNHFSAPGLIGPVTIRLDKGRFVGILTAAELQEYELDKPTAIPADLVSAQSLGEGDFFLCSAPKAFLTYFQQELSSGDLRAQQRIFEKNGVGAVVWLTLVKSANSDDHRAKIRAILENENIKNNPDKYIAYLGDDMNQVDIEGGPQVQVTYDNLIGYEPYLQTLIDAFKANPGAPNPVATSATAELTTAQDKFDLKKGEESRAALSLPMVAATIEGNKVVPTSAERPIVTVAFNKLKNAPPSEMTGVMMNIIKNYLKLNEGASDATDITQICSIHHLPNQVISNIVKGAWPLEITAAVTAENQLCSTMNLLSFRKQNPADTLLMTIASEEQDALNQGKSGVAGLSKAVREYFSKLGELNDSAATDALVNSTHILQTLYDLRAMRARGKPAIFDTLTKKLITKFATWATNEFATWRIKANFKGAQLGAMCFTWGERLFATFGAFASSLHNLQIMIDENGDLTDLDFKVINYFMKDFEAFVGEIETKIRLMIPCTDVPPLYLATIEGKKSNVADDASRQPAEERTGRSNQRNDSRDNRRSNQERAGGASRGNDERGTRRSNNSGDRDNQGDRKKQRQSSPSKIKPEENGILVLLDGGSFQDAFPPNFKACKHFVTRDKVCTKGNCDKEHWVSLTDALTRDAKEWAEHLRQNRDIGYFNQWKLKHLKDDPDFSDVCGPIGSPPTQRE